MKKTKPDKTERKRVTASRSAPQATSRPAPGKKAKTKTPPARPALPAPKKAAGKSTVKEPTLTQKSAAVPPRPAKSSSGTPRAAKKEFYELLLRLREQVVSQVRNLSSATLASTKQAGEELADVGSDNFTREIGLAMMTEDGRKLAQIQEALERLTSGAYGVCTDCGKDIAAARLKAIPYTKVCIDCQAARELQDKYSEEGRDDGNEIFAEGGENESAEKPSGSRDENDEEEEEGDSEDEADEAEA